MVTSPIVRWTKGVKTDNRMAPASQLHSGCGTDSTQTGDDDVIRATELFDKSQLPNAWRRRRFNVNILLRKGDVDPFFYKPLVDRGVQ